MEFAGTRNNPPSSARSIRSVSSSASRFSTDSDDTSTPFTMNAAGGNKGKKFETIAEEQEV
ncbi:unnamed protein product [Amoebophrya sp. A120]|nr:unnamed protein product [Amoebophrya sp. A120]|eukprot:GSA120T00019604001.1